MDTFWLKQRLLVLRCFRSLANWQVTAKINLIKLARFPSFESTFALLDSHEDSHEDSQAGFFHTDCKRIINRPNSNEFLSLRTGGNQCTETPIERQGLPVRSDDQGWKGVWSWHLREQRGARLAQWAVRLKGWRFNHHAERAWLHEPDSWSRCLSHT